MMATRHLLVITIRRGSDSAVFGFFFPVTPQGDLNAAPTRLLFTSLYPFCFRLRRFMWNSTLGKSSEEAEELTFCCPEHKLKDTMWSKQHCKEGQLGFIPPSPYSNGVHKRINCRGGAWPVLLKAWDNLQGLRWLFAVCSLALQQRRGLRDPSPHGGADRSWCIPDIFCLLVFHREGSE